MKKIKIFSCMLLIFLINLSLHPQDINVHFMIGKKQSDVIKKYGNPVHKDDSNPEMICMFYKNKLNTMIFVTNKTGVYQCEVLKVYESKNNALSELDECITSSINAGFAIDSVTANDFRLRKKGARADLQMSENVLTKKFELKIKANKSED